MNHAIGRLQQVVLDHTPPYSPVWNHSSSFLLYIDVDCQHHDPHPLMVLWIQRKKNYIPLWKRRIPRVQLMVSANIHISWKSTKGTKLISLFLSAVCQKFPPCCFKFQTHLGAVLQGKSQTWFLIYVNSLVIPDLPAPFWRRYPIFLY